MCCRCVNCSILHQPPEASKTSLCELPILHPHTSTKEPVNPRWSAWSIIPNSKMDHLTNTKYMDHELTCVIVAPWSRYPHNILTSDLKREGSPAAFGHPPTLSKIRTIDFQLDWSFFDEMDSKEHAMAAGPWHYLWSTLLSNNDMNDKYHWFWGHPAICIWSKFQVRPRTDMICSERSVWDRATKKNKFF